MTVIVIVFRVNQVSDGRIQAHVKINTLHKNACTGDRRAVAELFEVLTSRFRLFVRHKIWDKADAEEIVQEALMTISREYDKTTFTVSFSAWACKVLDNRILACLQKKKRENKRIDRHVEVGPETPDTVRGGEISPDLKRRLAECLRALCLRNPRYARTLNLHYQGYSTDDICDRMGTKPATFYSALSKGRSMLRECLEKGDTHV